ncbi:MAG: ion channel [Alphaproteobacteria bacterium]
MPRWLGAVTLTALLVGLVTFAIADVVSYLFVAVVVAIATGAAFFFLLFPGSRFFSIAFANFLAVYACIFEFFREANFAVVEGWVLAPGYLLPIVGFLLGAGLRRDEIRGIVTAQHLREERHFPKVLRWLAPVFGVGALTFVLPALGLDTQSYNLIFLGAMGLIAVMVFAASASICTFLIDTGLLFEEFFTSIAHLVVPGFAFLTFYSLLVIVFASVYRIIDNYSAANHFVIDGAPRAIDFSESLYFSLVTISTVGYGDILPASDIVRVIVAIEIMLGVLLLLFGFWEIVSYARDRRRHD